ncbi:OLC1v1029662C1 [Oldenlandia corymbosa var. corymbosa]|uniref:OLC1v1029662C1 n=1 Tax=Oldenlandia corymbosa var. corymbosa TaxID=529605 RepID=A0AAV1CFU5_OLDCO|nr:OLC1v1029662C1 [Oldenlandia corymbosa var. corymbosa]
MSLVFRGVCASWRSAATEAKFVNPLKGVPLLMLAEKKDSDEREFYSLSRRKIAMRLSLPEIKGRRCMEARFGWLLTVSISAVIYNGGTALGFWRSGDLKWTENGKFFAVDAGGTVCVWDESSRMVTYDECQPAMVADVLLSIRQLFVGIKEAYLLESSSGELIVVTRDGVGRREDSTYGVKNFEVIRLDVTKCLWEKIATLGADAIFVGHSAARSVVASMYPDATKPDCIYFTDDCFEAYTYSETFSGGGRLGLGGGEDMGIYCLEDGSIRFSNVESFSLYVH